MLYPKTNILFRICFSCLFLFIGQLIASAQVKPGSTSTTPTSIGSFGFIENKGQVYDQQHRPNLNVKYILPSQGMNVVLRSNGFSYDTYTADAKYQKHAANRSNHVGERTKPEPVQYQFHRVDISLVGANPLPEIIPGQPAADYIIYHSPGSEQGIRVQHYQKITYREIYKDIDLVFETGELLGQSRFEYYFIVRPGGNSNSIKIKYNGATSRLANNTIVLGLSHNQITERIPASYLLSKETVINLHELQQHKTVQVKYKSLGSNSYGFNIPDYDHTKTLVIDPTPDLVWGTYYGGVISDWSYSIAKDNIGNIIIGGGSNNNAVLATTGAYQSTIAGFSDGVIGKFQANGTRLWVTYYGGTRAEDIYTVTTDASNNIVFGGITESLDGIATAGTHQPVKAAGADCFISKFSPTGSRIWGTYMGGESVEYLHSLKTDAGGNIYLAGWTHSTTGISTAGAFQPNYAGGSGIDAGDAFIARFSSSGTRQWSTYYGGASFDRVFDMCLDNAGNICAAGVTNSMSTIASAGSFQPAFGGGASDAFIVKFDNNGGRIWSTYYGSSAQELAQCITVDKQDNIIIGGQTSSTTGLTTPGTHQPTFGGGTYEGVIAKFTAAGNRLWATYYGGNGNEDVLGVTTDASNNIFITGWSSSNANISTTDAYQVAGGGAWTTYLGKLNSSGIRQWATYYGSGGPFGEGSGEDIVTDAGGTIYITGWTSFTNGISKCTIVQPTWGGSSDMFLAAFSEAPKLEPTISITVSPAGTQCLGIPITFTALALNSGTSPTYQWKVNGVNVGTNSSVFTSSSLVNGDVVTVELIILPSVCNIGATIVSNAITVATTALVTPAITITSSATSICKGSTVNFTATAVHAGNDPVYQWHINGSAVGSNSSTFSTNTLVDGDIVSCVLTSSLPCVTTTEAVSNSIEITVSSVQLPSVSIAASSNSICKGEVVTFTATTSNAAPGSTIQWKLNGMNTGTNSNTYSNNKFSDGDKVSFVLTGTEPGCASAFLVNSDTITLIVRTRPVVTISPADTAIFLGESVTLVATVNGTVDNINWTPAVTLSSPSILNPVATPTENTEYTLQVTTASGCLAEGKSKINILTDIYIPSAFTPNNDGRNDLFKIPDGIAITLTNLAVYDRWGNMVFKTSNIREGWDGTFNGARSPAAVYIYIIEGSSTRGNIFLKGTVTLIR